MTVEFRVYVLVMADGRWAYATCWGPSDEIFLQAGVPGGYATFEDLAGNFPEWAERRHLGWEEHRVELVIESPGSPVVTRTYDMKSGGPHVRSRPACV